MTTDSASWSGVVSDLVCARAAMLARHSEYGAAEDLLLALIGSHQGNLPALDLLARIRAQQGSDREARELWEEALRRDPANPLYRAAIHRLDTRRRWVAGRLAIILALGLACLAGAAGVRRKVAPAPPVPQPRAEVRQPPPLRPDDWRVAYSEAAMEGNAVRVSFPGGLFLRNTRLKPEGRRALAELARRLAAFPDQIEIAISGQTDGLPVARGGPFSDNTSLAAMRAAVAHVELLRGAPHLSNLKLLAGSRQDVRPGIRQPSLRSAVVVISRAR